MIDKKDLQLKALLEVSQAINNNLSEEDLYRIYMFTLLGDLKIQKLNLFVKKNTKWVNQIAYGTQNKIKIQDIENTFDTLTKSEELHNNPPFQEFHWVIPIIHNEELLALLFIENLADTTFIKTLTNILIVAIQNKKLILEKLKKESYQRELEIAKKVQNFLFPKSLPYTDKLKVKAFYQPHYNVGGDYYDFIKISKNSYLFCIADVSGKGVPAALLMSNFQATLHTLLRKTKNIKDIVHELNTAIYLSGNGENFITFFVALYHTQKHQLEYINCGHNPPFLSLDSSLHRLKKGTTILGMFKPLPFLESTVFKKIKNFKFISYTDGLTETFNEKGELYGEERLENFIKNTQNIDDLYDNLVAELNEFKGNRPFDDDITLLMCQIIS